MTSIDSIQVVSLMGISLCLAVAGLVLLPLEHHPDLVRQEREARKAKAKSSTQADLQHDVQHRGFGFRDDDPDRLDCRDRDCPRNTGTRRVGP